MKLKEESEKSGLKLKLKNWIMESSPVISCKYMGKQ